MRQTAEEARASRGGPESESVHSVQRFDSGALQGWAAPSQNRYGVQRSIRRRRRTAVEGAHNSLRPSPPGPHSSRHFVSRGPAFSRFAANTQTYRSINFSSTLRVPTFAGNFRACLDGFAVRTAILAVRSRQTTATGMPTAVFVLVVHRIILSDFVDFYRRTSI